VAISALARAMSTALVLEADGRRSDGRWKRGSIGIGEVSDTGAGPPGLVEDGVICPDQ